MYIHMLGWPCGGRFPIFHQTQIIFLLFLIVVIPSYPKIFNHIPKDGWFHDMYI